VSPFVTDDKVETCATTRELNIISPPSIIFAQETSIMMLLLLINERNLVAMESTNILQEKKI
jgi:hypothetical protein